MTLNKRIKNTTLICMCKYFTKYNNICLEMMVMYKSHVISLILIYIESFVTLSLDLPGRSWIVYTTPHSHIIFYKLDSQLSSYFTFYYISTTSIWCFTSIGSSTTSGTIINPH